MSKIPDSVIEQFICVNQIDLLKTDPEDAIDMLYKYVKYDATEWLQETVKHSIRAYTERLNNASN